MIMAADTFTETPVIEIAGKHTQAQLGKALLEAAQRARESDRCTNVTSGGQVIAAVVPFAVGDARDVYTLLDPPAKTGKIIKRGEPIPVPGPGVQLALDTGEPVGEPAS
jgi:hypothetical protein